MSSQSNLGYTKWEPISKGEGGLVIPPSVNPDSVTPESSMLRESAVNKSPQICCGLGCS